MNPVPSDQNSLPKLISVFLTQLLLLTSLAALSPPLFFFYLSLPDLGGSSTFLSQRLYLT